jgi:dipeptidyl aminopeptidase/acylaminoacyl peptidase
VAANKNDLGGGDYRDIMAGVDYVLRFEHVDPMRMALIGYGTTPMLLLQGLDDTTDPPGQAQEMYRALRQNGVPVNLVVYPRDDHAALSKALPGSPVSESWHGFDALRRVESFIQQAFDAAH